MSEEQFQRLIAQFDQVNIQLEQILARLGLAEERLTLFDADMDCVKRDISDVKAAVLL